MADVVDSAKPARNPSTDAWYRRSARWIARTQLSRRVIGSVDGVHTRDPLFALTFDDGPDPGVTPRILDALDAHGATATFFMPAERALAAPALAREVAARGHEIGVHGFTHTRLTEVPLRRFRHETGAARREIARVVGVQPHWFRPPFGAQNLRTYLATRAQGMDVAVWRTSVRDAVSTDGVDCAPGPDGAIVLRARGAELTMPAGSIMLLHDTPAASDAEAGVDAARQRKVELVDRILDAVDRAGGRVVTVSELLRSGTPDRRVWRSAGY